MQFKLAILLTLVATSVQGAVLKTRSESCTCAGRAYSAADTQGAITQAHRGPFRYTTKRKTTDYPHEFHAFDVALDFSAKCTPPFIMEFPLVAGGLYAGGSPGLDRVVYDLSGDFCGCMTHSGAVGNGFKHC